MLKSRLLAGAALAVLSLPIATPSPGLPFAATAAQAQSASVSFQLFFEQLHPHGVWVRHARYQYVFCPTGVDAKWRPHTHGRWLYVEGRGWYFASEEPFAWATYHYGRWFPDRNLGWCWVPGTKWAPAWVSWRRSDSAVGWAPLPPEEDGYAVSVVVRGRDLPEGYWVFVPTERFIEPDLSVSIVIDRDQPNYYTQTQFLGPVVVEGDVVVNNVIDISYIEQTINQQVIVYQPQEAASPSDQSVAVEAQTIAVFDQDAAPAETEAAPPDAVDEAQAPEAIEAAGGTAGATVEIADEGEADTGTPPAAPAAEQPATPAEGGAETAPPAPDVAAPAPEAQPSQPAPTEAEQPAANEGQPAAKEPPCPPESMVDGKCPVPGAQQPGAEPTPPAEQPAPEAPAPEAPVAPAEAQPSAPAEAPAPQEQPAPTEQQAPAEEAAPPAEAAPAPEAKPDDQLPCPPEVRVDGKCPPLEQ
jgi:hypothetical protein